MTLGTVGEPGEDSTHLNRPTDVAVAPGGDTFVTDGYGNNRVVHFDERGQFVGTWGSLGSGPGQFSLPHSIALDSQGRLFVADRNNARVQVFDQAGRFLDEWRDLLVPWHIVITDRDEIYVCGSSPMRWPKLPIPGLIVGIPPKDQLVMVFTPDGRATRLCTFPKGQRSGELDWVHALAVDRRGNLYLGDIQGRRAQKFVRLDPAGREGPIAKDGAAQNVTTSSNGPASLNAGSFVNATPVSVCTGQLSRGDAFAPITQASRCKHILQCHLRQIFALDRWCRLVRRPAVTRYYCSTYVKQFRLC